MLTMREMMRTELNAKLNSISIKMEKELAQSMLQELSEKLKLVNKDGMLGVVTVMTATLPLIRCEEGAPTLTLASDQLAKCLTE